MLKINEYEGIDSIIEAYNDNKIEIGDREYQLLRAELWQILYKDGKFFIKERPSTIYKKGSKIGERIEKQFLNGK